MDEQQTVGGASQFVHSTMCLEIAQTYVYDIPGGTAEYGQADCPLREKHIVSLRSNYAEQSRVSGDKML